MLRGAHLENLILCDLLAWRDLQIRPTQVLYWHTRAALEEKADLTPPGGTVAFAALSLGPAGLPEREQLARYAHLAT